MSQDLRNNPTTKPAIAEALRDIQGSPAALAASAQAAPAAVDLVTIKSRRPRGPGQKGDQCS